MRGNRLLEATEPSSNGQAVESRADSGHNRAQAMTLYEILRESIAKATLRGFYGAIAITYNVVDGTIQDLKVETEQRYR